MQVKREGAQNKQNVPSWSDSSDTGMTVPGRKGRAAVKFGGPAITTQIPTLPPHLLARISSMWAGTLKEVS